MKNSIKYVILILVFMIIIAHQTQCTKSDIIFQKNVMIPMSDNIQLATNITRPATDGKYPTILIRTPYGKENEEDDVGEFWARKGYVFLVQDCRGTNKSEGEWNPGFYEYQDGIDMRNWIKNQEWSNGKIGTTGGSYLGYTQFVGATNVKNPQVALFAFIPLFDWHDFAYFGGAFSLGDIFSWSAEMASPNEGEGALLDEDNWDWEKEQKKSIFIRGTLGSRA